MTISEKIISISKGISLGELLAQTSEEADEVGKAALKYRRTITPGASPTPTAPEEALDNLAEELADIDICASCVKEALPPEEAKAFQEAYERYYGYKLDRFRNRIRQVNEKAGKEPREETRA